MLMLPTLETERLLLRRFEMADAGQLTALLQSPETIEMLMDITHPYTEAEAEAMIRRSHQEAMEGTACRFALERPQDFTLIGYMDIEVNLTHQRGELAYWIGQPFWHQGYAAEAARRVVQFGFEELKLNRVYAYCLEHNSAAARVLEKAGLVREGVFRQGAYHHGSYEDVAFYGLLRTGYGD